MSGEEQNCLPRWAARWPSEANAFGLSCVVVCGVVEVNNYEEKPLSVGRSLAHSLRKSEEQKRAAAAAPVAAAAAPPPPHMGRSCTSAIVDVGFS